MTSSCHSWLSNVSAMSRGLTSQQGRSRKGATCGLKAAYPPGASTTAIVGPLLAARNADSSAATCVYAANTSFT